MKYLIILIFIILSTPISSSSNPINDDCIDNTPVVRCLRSMVVGGQNGGFWKQWGGPQDMTALLVGDNPCWEWSTVACGQYTFRYYVQTPCCIDSTTIRPRKCCSSVVITCN